MKVTDVDYSFHRLFSQIGQDFRQFPQKENLMWLGVGASLSLAAHRADGNLAKSFSGSAQLEHALNPGRVIGGALVQVSGSFLTYAVGRMTDKPAIAHIGSDLVRAQVLAQGITQGIKIASRRTRPDGTAMSFPSGHSASAFASATVLRNHYGWKAGVPAYALAGYVAANRLADSRHYVSDVIFGAAVGILAARTVTVGHGSFQFTVTPFVTPGGAGISLVKSSQ